MEIKVIRKGESINVLIDIKDYKLIANKTLSIDKAGYVRVYVKGGSKVYLHRLLLCLTDRKIEVDHINHIRHDCRRSNLRICTHRQNSANRLKSEGKSSGFYGVHFNKTINMFYSQVQINGQKHMSKAFNDEISAAIAHDIMAIKLQGEFACINYPELIMLFNDLIFNENNQITADNYLKAIPDPNYKQNAKVH